MKKIFFFAFLLALCLPCVASAADSSEDKYWKVYQLDHKETKDVVTTVKIWKKLGRLKETKYSESNFFTPAAEDKQRGYTLFSKGAGEDIYPNNKPGKDDALKELSGSGVKGQFVPLVFCLLAHEDLSGVSLEVTDLVKEGGKSIPKESISPFHIQYEYMRADAGQILKGRYLAPGACDVPEGITRALWLTVSIPAGAESGVYKGSVTVNVSGKTKTELPVTLEVFPFEFAEYSKGHTWWMWYYNGYPEDAVLEQHLINLKNHGMTCFDSAVPASYKINGDAITVDFTTADRVAPLLKKYGFNKWMFDNTIYFQIAKDAKTELWSPLHTKLFRSLLTQFKEREKKDGWPEVIWTLDEPREQEDDKSRTYRTYNDVMNYCNILKDTKSVSNVSWTHWGNAKTDYTKLIPQCDLTTTHGLYEPCDLVIKRTHEYNKPLLLYNCGPTRYAFGVLVKQNKALGNSQFWWGAAHYGDPTTPYAHSSCAVLKRDGSVVDTVEWEQIREGVYDYEYLWTLEQAIKKYKGSDMAAVRAAERVLSAAEAINYPRGKGDAYGSDFMSEHMKDFKGSQLDQMRLKAARAIASLTGEKTK